MARIKTDYGWSLDAGPGEDRVLDNAGYNDNGLTFRQFMEEVDEAIDLQVGMSHMDIADYAYWDAWNDGSNPDDVAQAALAEEGFC